MPRDTTTPLLLALLLIAPALLAGCLGDGGDGDDDGPAPETGVWAGNETKFALLEVDTEEASLTARSQTLVVYEEDAYALHEANRTLQLDGPDPGTFHTAVEVHDRWGSRLALVPDLVTVAVAVNGTDYHLTAAMDPDQIRVRHYPDLPLEGPDCSHSRPDLNVTLRGQVQAILEPGDPWNLQVFPGPGEEDLCPNATLRMTHDGLWTRPGFG